MNHLRVVVIVVPNATKRTRLLSGTITWFSHHWFSVANIAAGRTSVATAAQNGRDGQYSSIQFRYLLLHKPYLFFKGIQICLCDFGTITHSRLFNRANTAN